MDTNGLVTINATAGTTQGRTLASTFLTPTPTEWSFASLVDNLLGALPSAACIVVDKNTRKVYFTDDATKAGLLKDAATKSGDAVMAVITPDSGQSGKSLLWQTPVYPNGAVGPDGEVDATVAATRPKRSVASLVTALITAANGQNDQLAYVVIDQVNKTVYGVDESEDRAASLAALSLNAGNSGILELSEPATAGTASPLPFEGGAV